MTAARLVNYLLINSFLGHNDRDISCVISSLIQIICDPHFRSISGFEALIQKEWVALGHPFTTRCGLVTNSANEEVNEGQVRTFKSRG